MSEPAFPTPAVRAPLREPQGHRAGTASLWGSPRSRKWARREGVYFSSTEPLPQKQLLRPLPSEGGGSRPQLWAGGTSQVWAQVPILTEAKGEELRFQSVLCPTGFSGHDIRTSNPVLKETWSLFPLIRQGAEGSQQAEQASEARRDDASARLWPLWHGSASV